jgi:haloacetate dehalogenase
MPEFYLDHILNSWSRDSSMISRKARAEYLRCFKNPKVIEGICEEYRSSENDSENDRLDLTNGKRITCPVLVLWSKEGFTTSFGDPLKIWKNWADDLRGSALSCGHFLMEEAPDAVFNEMFNFWNTKRS